jgi:hypothetical protein
MSDPFSISVGALAVISACVTLGSKIYELQKESRVVGDELRTLLMDINGLKDLCQTVKATYETRSTDAVPPSAEQAQILDDLWAHLGNALENCLTVIKKLDGIFSKIRGHTGDEGLGKFDAVVTAFKKRLKEKDLQECRAQMAAYQSALQIVLSLITRHDIGISQYQNSRSFETLAQEFKSLDENIQSQIVELQQTIKSTAGSSYDGAALAALRGLQESVNFAARTMESASTNYYFDVPQSVSSIFTGRNTLLQDLQRIFFPRQDRRRNQIQRRFIIHGLGGSGKTQFCCKFAQDNRDSFWGVFWIDASSPERANQTFGDIAETVGLEKNQKSVLHWLSNLDHSWLLIIDNADDEDVPLERYFPKGDRGNILVTTRNPAYKMHGNIGPQYYEFRGLELDEATQLLLKASQAPVPWDSSCKSLALRITEKLGSLALAIIHAGAAIRDRLCTLADYLEYYYRSFRKIRNAKLTTKSSDSDRAVYATWELCYSHLEQRGTEAALDALELLNMLAFLHWEAIPPEIFSRTLRNPAQEAKQEIDRPVDLSQPPIPWHTFATKRVLGFSNTLLVWLLQSKGQSVLPRLLRGGGNPDSVEYADDRVRYALKELVKMSMIIYNDRTGTYTMHPIVHIWARERPRMKLAEQALWADVTGRVLAASILLPPLGTAAADEKYHISLLPHVEHVQVCRQAIAKAILAERSSTKLSYSWFTTLVPNLAPDADRIRMYAKFSLVYAKCGQWQSAEQLLEDVKRFLYQYLGPQHKRSRQVALFLSTVYWQLGRPADAAELQSSVLKLCESHLGPSHPETLRAMSELGRTRWQQGQYSVARSLQQEVLQKLLLRLPRDHADVLEAMDNLGLTVLKFWERRHFEEAFKLHAEAATGMAKVHGPEHEQTLFAREHFCRAAVLLGGQHLESTRDTMNGVLETRRAKLGKEHPYTLLAMVNMAIVLAAMGHHDEAMALIRLGLPVAERNLGPDHIGTLFGRQTLACILVQCEKYAAAEEILVEVSVSQKKMASHRGDYHPDRLATLVELAHCSYSLGKIKSAIALCDEAIRGFDSISRSPHPIALELRTTRTALVLLDQGEESRTRQASTPDSSNRGITFPFIIFRPYQD